MTNTLTLRSFDIPSIHKFGVGFDSLFNELARVHNSQSNNNYPPYNVVKHTDDKFAIEVAIAGFREGDISITVDKNILTIAGEQAQDLDDITKEYLHHGISSRNFARTFTLADHVEVVSAAVANGILTVILERKVPEELQPKKIAITFNK
jgi:molecular chaperone IbpA